MADKKPKQAQSKNKPVPKEKPPGEKQKPVLRQSHLFEMVYKKKPVDRD